MERTDLMDTADWAHREIVRRLRLMSEEEKAQMIEETIVAGLEMARLAERRLNEDEPERAA